MIFVAETLRKHPVGGNITRIATKPYKVPDTNFTIPKGMKVYVPVFAIHHDETYYPNPEEFNPDRWISGGDNIPTKGAFLPFGDGSCIFLTFFIISSLIVRFYHLIRFLFSVLTGPRKCIGYGVAKQLIGTALVSILQHFKFSTCERTQIPIKYSTTKNTLIPSDGVWLNVQQI